MSAYESPSPAAEECYACMVGVATGPESHTPECAVRNIPMPEQDGQFGPEWDAYDQHCEKARAVTAVFTSFANVRGGQGGVA